jgi:hypothetical protein
VFAGVLFLLAKEHTVTLLNKDAQRACGATQNVESLVLPDGSYVYTSAVEPHIS